MSRHTQVTEFRVQGAVDEVSFAKYPRTDAGAHCDIDDIAHAAGRAALQFTKQRGIDIGIDAK